MMTSEACVGVLVYNVTGLSRTVFSYASESQAQTIYSYIESYEYAEVYDGV